MDKEALVKFNGFLAPKAEGSYLILNEGGYQIEGQTDTWKVIDEKNVQEQRFVQWKQNITRIKNSFQMIDILGERAYNVSTRIGGDYMLDVNMIIANNIQAELKKENKKQVDLAEGIGVSKQTMSKIMNGARAINAIELHKISEYLHVSMDSLMKMPEKPMDTNVIHAFMGRVKTEEARKGIRLADELSDMILFHTRVCENGKKMEQPWEDK